MIEEALEAQADDLLTAAAQDPGAPFYTERQLRRKLTIEESRIADAPLEESSTESGPEREATDLQVVVGRAALSADERRVLNLALNGHTQAQIAAVVGLAQQRVSELLQRATRKVRRQWEAGHPRPSARDLRDLFWAETHRYLYRPPRHCAGQPCRRLRRRFNTITREWEKAHYCSCLQRTR
jgi:DNA-binding CsgD family transcriptional regulator